MRIRRCAALAIVPGQRIDLDLAGLLCGQVPLQPVGIWQVLAAHLDHPVAVSGDQLELLRRLDPQHWQAVAGEDAGTDPLSALLASGLVLADPGSPAAVLQADRHVRDGYWHGLSAVYARHARWHDADVVEAMDTPGLATALGLRQALGPAPAATLDDGDPGQAVPLPRAPASTLSQLLQQRVTCRNFCARTPLALAALGEVMELAFAAHGQVWVSPDMGFLKRSSPSAGGLHGIEAYLLVQRVEGLAPGWYHYRPLEHRLAPLPAGAEAVAGQAHGLLAGQHWFAGAPVLVVLVARYQRVFWKYREHAKALRALLLEAGHFSQTLYLAATQAGLGAYVTCAINEPVAEAALATDPLQHGILAVCGVGVRDREMTTAELDPGGHVWQPLDAPQTRDPEPAA